MKRMAQRVLVGAAGLALFLTASGTAQAVMVLTAAGTSKGFSLTTFADGFPNSGGVGPVGVVVTGTGSVIVSSYAVGKNAVFATDTDGQHYAGATLSATTYSTPSGLDRVGTHIYQALQGPGQVIEVDTAGNFVATIATGLSSATGLVANPANGHLFVSTPGVGNIFDINPITHAVTLFKSGVNFDGITISSDGSILYGANLSTNHIEGYNTTTGLKVFDSGTILGGGLIDGSALGSGVLAGFIYVNTNGGVIVEVNMTTLAQTIIATGGSRGDLVGIDPNGTLLLTQTDRVLRLTGPAGGGFGGTVPEPTSIALLGMGALSMAGYTWRRKRRQAV